MAATGAIIWFTGLSGSGKSTISEKLVEYLRENKKTNFEYLDGDSVRTIFPQTGFSYQERIDHLRKIGFVASLLEKHGVLVVASFISPYKESRDMVRKMCSNFIEIYISTPLEVCEKRDVKGLYKKARKGDILHFTGISDPYEAPLSPELEIDTSQISLDDSIRKIISYLKDRKYL